MYETVNLGLEPLICRRGVGVANRWLALPGAGVGTPPHGPVRRRPPGVRVPRRPDRSPAVPDDPRARRRARRDRLPAERIGAQGRLISTDLSAGMVDAAQRGAEARGLGNVECPVIDAQAIELPDAASVCSCGASLMVFAGGARGRLAVPSSFGSEGLSKASNIHQPLESRTA